jgi:ABC-2 type transport system ATP-binding protein
MADEAGIAISARKLSASRQNERVVHEVNLEIERGRWFGLIGANGCGKTTLLRAMAGRLEIDEGACYVNGTDCTASRKARATIIDFSPTVDSLPGLLSPRQIFELVSPEWQANAGDVYDALAIKAFIDLPVSCFSAGMRQRVAIACAFAAGRNIVVLDEPFNWLDPVAAFDLRTALRAKTNEGLTLITALHDMTTVATCCDNGVLMNSGRIAAAIGAEQLTAGQADISAFEQQMIEVLRAGK